MKKINNLNVVSEAPFRTAAFGWEGLFEKVNEMSGEKVSKLQGDALVLYFPWDLERIDEVREIKISTGSELVVFISVLSFSRLNKDNRVVELETLNAIHVVDSKIVEAELRDGFNLDAIYLLAPPVDLPEFRPVNANKNFRAAVIWDGDEPLNGSWQEFDAVDMSKFSSVNSQNFISELVGCFASYSDVLVLCSIPVSGWAFLAAALECRIYSNCVDVFSHIVFPHTAHFGVSKEEVLNSYIQSKEDPDLKAFILELARHKVEYYNFSNSHVRFLSFMEKNYVEIPSNRMVVASDRFIFEENINKLDGLRKIDLDVDEFAVVCVARDASLYIEEWLNHYLEIGARHIFVVDNKSTDDTLEKCGHHPQLTLFSTDLPFKYFESEIRRYIVETCCIGGWCLTVDIDEFFDFPCSDRLGMGEFLKYVYLQGDTAVTAHMLDMFSLDNETKGKPFLQSDIYYEISTIREDRYTRLNGRYFIENKVSDTNQSYFYGGVRSNENESVGAQAQFLLLKHPLTYQGGNVVPQVDPHFCDGAKISPVRCVLFHYKLNEKYKLKVLERAENKVFNYFANKEYNSYLLKFKRDKEIFKYRSPLKYKNLYDLQKAGFIHAPASLIKYCYGL